MVYFCYLFTSAISQGMQILLGRYLGAKRYDDANVLVLKTNFWAVVVSFVVSFVIFAFSDLIFGIMVPSSGGAVSQEKIIEMCKTVMLIEMFLEIGRAVNICMVRALQTSGDVMYPTILSIIFCWIVAVLGGYLFGVHFNFGIYGIWIAMAIDEIIRGIIILIRWLNGKWKKYDLVAK